MSRAAPFAHLLALTDDIAVFEHAERTTPRREHGYCVDDVARALVVLARRGPSPPAHAPDADQDDDAELSRVAERCLRFVAGCQDRDGRVVNRRDVRGTAHGPYGVEDCWGRALWGLGTTAARRRDAGPAGQALQHFERGATLRSLWPHAMAFAGLGAAEVLRLDVAHAAARSLLRDAATAVAPADVAAWPWPWARLSYANAVVPEVLLAAADALGDDRLLEQGLSLLGWLLDVETAGGHLSVTPAGGWAAGEPRPGFDQQAIEVATLADACARAFDLTGERRWADAVVLAGGWFTGLNDIGVALYDERTGGCCDGLEAHGRNENQGAESTLALISTMQQVDRLAALTTVSGTSTGARR